MAASSIIGANGRAEVAPEAKIFLLPLGMCLPPSHGRSRCGLGTHPAGQLLADMPVCFMADIPSLHPASPATSAAIHSSAVLERQLFSAQSAVLPDA
jgi:hypothetical protein